MRKKRELNLEDILTDKAAVEDLLEVPVKSGVFSICFFIIVSMVLSGASRLFSLNIFKGDFYRQRALANISEIAVQKAERGIIFDRYGKPLVKNKPIFNAVLNPSQFTKEKAEKEIAINKITESLNLTPVVVDKILNRFWYLFPMFHKTFIVSISIQQ
jgi:cell division protein FtsI/penicillin-binding protein 2